MDILNIIEDESILIVPSTLKKKILRYFNDNKFLKSIKMMSFKDLKNGLLFDYSNQTIWYVMNNYNVSYKVALEYINSLYYLNDSIQNEKYIFLKKLYDELTEKNLLIKDPLFINFIKSKKKLYVFGYSFIDKYNMYLLDMVEKYITIEILENNCNNYNHNVYNCDSIYLEIKFVAEEISKLIEKGVDLNKIYIANYNDEYRFVIKYIFDKYNIPVYLKNNDSLYSSVIGHYFLEHINLNKDKLLHKLEKVFDAKNNPNNAIIINKIFNLVNNYYWCESLCDVLPLLIEEMKKIKLNDIHLTKEIITTDIINNVFNDDEYVFLIGFNQSSIPLIKKDEDYINDDIKPDFVDTSIEYNNKIKCATVDALSSIKNLIITYKLSSSTSTYLPSYLIKNENLNVVKVQDFISKYSKDINEIYEAECLDNLSKYNVLDENLNILINNYEIPYMTYNNDFKGVNNKLLLDTLNNNVNLSFSALNNYFECPFKFYVNNVLKINKYEQKFDAFIGSLFHHCLENCLDNTSNIDKTYDDYIKDKWPNPTNGEKFFLKLLKDEIKVIIDIIKEQYTHSKKHNVVCEKVKSFTIDKNIKFNFKGIVDKLILINNNGIIVDYKTGTKNIDKGKFKYGLDLQLPIYLYLLKKTEPDINICGFYLQHILNYSKKKNGENSYDKRMKTMKLDGYTIDYNISLFDDTFESSKIIKGLKMKDGEFNSKYFFDKEEVDKLINLIEEKINTATDNIIDGNFKVHPLYLDKNYGCEFCEYKDICFRKPANINYQNYESDGDNFE